MSNRKVWRVQFDPDYAPEHGGGNVRFGEIYADSYEVRDGDLQFYDYGDSNAHPTSREALSKPGPSFARGTWHSVYPQGWQD